MIEKQATTVVLPAEKRERHRALGWSLLWIVLATLVIRLVTVIFAYPAMLDPARNYWKFGYETGKIAASIASGHGFSNPLFAAKTGPTAWIPPVYPYMLAGIFKQFGTYSKASAIAILSLNSLFSALTCLPIYFIARKSFGRHVAVAAAWTWAFFPYAIYFSAGWIWETSLSALLLTLILMITLQLEGATHLWAWAGYGALWGLAALNSPVVLSLLPFLLAWVCFRRRQNQRIWRLPAAISTMLLIVIITPWLIRNYRTFHQPIFLQDDFWLAFHVGNSGNFMHWWNDAAHPAHSTAELNEMRTVGEITYMAEKRQQSLPFLKDHPGTFVWLTVRRISYVWTGYWSFSPTYLRDEPFEIANIAYCSVWDILALAGLFLAFVRGRDSALPFCFFLVFFPLPYYLVDPDIFYRHPIDPEIVMLAVYAVSQIRFSTAKTPITSSTNCLMN